MPGLFLLEPPCREEGEGGEEGRGERKGRGELEYAPGWDGLLYHNSILIPRPDLVSDC